MKVSQSLAYSKKVGIGTESFKYQKTLEAHCVLQAAIT